MNSAESKTGDAMKRRALLGLAAATVALGLAAAPAAAAPPKWSPMLLAPPMTPVLAGPARSAPAPALRTAGRFAVLGGTTITTTGHTVINGGLGLHPGTGVTGSLPGTVNGDEHLGDAVAQRAKADLATAYTDAAGRPFSATSPADLGGRTLTAGVYRAGLVPSIGLTGRVTLDAQGDPRAVFIFQSASTLISATDSSVSLINGAQACNVLWQVGSSATLGKGTSFQGSVLALTSISVKNGATVNGRLLARNGAVTLINDTVTRPECAAVAPPRDPAPQVLDVHLSKPAVIGRDTSLVVEAIGTRAPVSGVSVQFGRSRDVFATSACRPPDSEGNVPRAFKPGKRTRLAIPHRFRKKGKQRVLVRVDSGGCSSLTSVYQTVTVTPTSPGEPPRPPIVSPPTLVKPPGSVIAPNLPVSGAASRGPALASRRRGQCAGAGRLVGRTAKSLAAARLSLLCLLNAERRAQRLPRLRMNPRLERAAKLHSRSMVLRGYFSHEGPGGRDMVARVTRSGYLRNAGTWSISENIGSGSGPGSPPRYMTRAWMGSTPHRANILARKFREVGLGIVPGVPGRAGDVGGTYTTIFGYRR